MLAAPARQSGSLERTDHRPWPVPERSWLMGQTWDQLLFAHWPVPVEQLAPHVPEQFSIDTFDGSAWVGITPFLVSSLRLRGTLPMPVLSNFLETNVRTYVIVDGKPGIWFFSLDAESRFAVTAARKTYRLPYFRASMTRKLEGTSVVYATSRADRHGHNAQLAVQYQAAGVVEEPRPGTLEHFLTERYCLYTVHRGKPYRADIHHEPWPLQPADAEIARNSMPPPAIELPDHDPVLHYSERQDVVIWSLDELTPRRRPRFARGR